MKTFIYGWLAAGALWTAACAPAAAEVVWKAPIWGPSRSSTQPFEWYAKEVSARSGGQLRIETSYGQAKQTESFDAVKTGAVDAAYFCGTSNLDKTLLSTVLELPMLAPDDLRTLGRVELALSEHPAIQANLRTWNVKMLVPSLLPQYQLMGTKRIARIEDFKGARVRISPEMGKVLEEYGAAVSALPVSEIHAAMKGGVVDVAALPYPYGFHQFRIHEVARYVTDKISLGTPFCYFGVSNKAWEALPARVQALMLELRAPAVARYEEIYAREDAQFIATFKERGLEFVPFSVPDRARLLAKTVKVWQAWVEEREKQGLKGREVLEFTQAKIREFSRR